MTPLIMSLQQSQRLYSKNIYTMWKLVKAQLAKALIKPVKPTERNMQAMHVIDGGPFFIGLNGQKATYKDYCQALCKLSMGRVALFLMGMSRVLL